MILILLILVIPLFLSVVSLLMNNHRRLGVINSAGYLVIFLAGIKIVLNVSLGNNPIAAFNFFYCDALSAFFIFTISIICFAASLYSIGYISSDVKNGAISIKKSGVYYLLFNLFSFSMFLLVSVNNLGLMWAAMEITTLVSAFLVGFYNSKQSVEAAWKYIIICSVGIIFALLGTILFSYAFLEGGGIKTLNWAEMMLAADKLNPNIAKIAFIFILVGFGTKAGLAPMHTWLPDAHSQAVAPISALLSGVLLKTALYAILRFGIILNKSIGPGYFSHLLIFFGLLSLLISSGFIIVQKDIKRLLAYSSIEHIGLICLGIGVGGYLGLFGAFLHLFNHAVTKSLMFFSAGNIVQFFKKHSMDSIKGLFWSMPFTGAVFLLGTLAIGGLPPFSIFVSEIMIAQSIFNGGNYFLGFLILGLLAVIFGAIINHFSKIIFGVKTSSGEIIFREGLSVKLSCIFLLVFIIGLGVVIPPFFKNAINSAVKVIIN